MSKPLRESKFWDYLEITVILFIVLAVNALLQLSAPMLSGLPTHLWLLIANGLTHTVWVLAAAVACTIRKVPLLEGLGLRRERLGRQLLLGFAVFVPILLLVGMITAVWGKTDVLTATELVYHLIRMMIFVGIGEEIVFRGYLTGKLKRMGFSDKKAILWSSAVFGLGHILNSDQAVSVSGVVIAFILGLYFAVVIHKFKDCTPLTTGVAHGLTNSFAEVFAFLFG